MIEKLIEVLPWRSVDLGKVPLRRVCSLFLSLLKCKGESKVQGLRSGPVSLICFFV